MQSATSQANITLGGLTLPALQAAGYQIEYVSSWVHMTSNNLKLTLRIGSDSSLEVRCSAEDFSAVLETLGWRR